MNCQKLKLKIIFYNNNFINELIFLNEFRGLFNCIVQLDNSKLTLTEQYNIIDNFKKNIKTSECATKFNDILFTNPEYTFFSKYTILNCSFSNRIMNYCALTSVWVERSFSSYTYIFNNLKRSLDVDTLK